jgi:hypothetical protein
VTKNVTTFCIDESLGSGDVSANWKWLLRRFSGTALGTVYSVTSPVSIFQSWNTDYPYCNSELSECANFNTTATRTLLDVANAGVLNSRNDGNLRARISVKDPVYPSIEV